MIARELTGEKTMTLTINLAPDEEAQLQAHAAQKGLLAEEYIRTALRHEFQRDAPKPAQTASPWAGKSLAGALEGRIGLFRSETEDGGPSHTAEDTGAEFTKTLVEKYRKQGLEL